MQEIPVVRALQIFFLPAFVLQLLLFVFAAQTAKMKNVLSMIWTLLNMPEKFVEIIFKKKDWNIEQTNTETKH